MIALLVSAITSQNGTAPKRVALAPSARSRAITSQNGTAPKLRAYIRRTHLVRLPVRTALLQNPLSKARTATRCDYQSERHCSKTRGGRLCWLPMCDYQSERHCSKTAGPPPRCLSACDYQSERHCSKTDSLVGATRALCDYQSERHCSKT